ncbi:MAG: RagB/SusD family nutrient uptake outer membrane protein [Gemmatimonadota bacterium]|nr:RagB/SusD family nutrient uptake outer membrane protein [Gemmatimonadota bacterium]MDH4350047.1 RagB/SusD family nutrient uptake outer membrane protein [Gemmatimonadota bacterium]MDH5196882.1 RagB/SusD family nutrient uptake outer membrane protein [Gemmatimonadota bacterium]
MQTPRFRSLLSGARRALLVAPLALALSLQACTDLTEDPTSSIAPNSFFKNEQEVLGALAGVYSVMKNPWSWYNLNEITSDEMIVPTRGQDWFDNGRWLELHRQGWTATSSSALDDINGMWSGPFSGVTRANVVLSALTDVTIADKEAVIAETRVLRAFYYYQLMDMFGGVPIVTDLVIEPRAAASRDSVFRFIESELIAARQDLPVAWPASQHGRMTKGAASAILANMYVNAAVYTTSTPSATSYNSCASVTVTGGQTACDAAIAAADAVLADYSLAPEGQWRSNFTADNATSLENVLVAKQLNEPGLGLDLVMRALHYNQFNPSPWNGFAALADAYRAFDADDERREVLLEGQQYCVDPNGCGSVAFGGAVDDRSGAPLLFTIDIVDASAATEGEGTRVMKYLPDPDHVAQENGNDFVYFRAGEMVMIKAEAELAKGNGAAALTLVNQLRARVFEPDEPLTSIDQDGILRERLFEFAGEAKRRQDLIRHGKYTQAWAFKTATEAYKVLMPIPQPQIDANPLLGQNPGY